MHFLQIWDKFLHLPDIIKNSSGLYLKQEKPQYNLHQFIPALYYFNPQNENIFSRFLYILIF